MNVYMDFKFSALNWTESLDNCTHNCVKLSDFKRDLFTRVTEYTKYVDIFCRCCRQHIKPKQCKGILMFLMKTL